MSSCSVIHSKVTVSLKTRRLACAAPLVGSSGTATSCRVSTSNAESLSGGPLAASAGLLPLRLLAE
jgi:hypothetical protein